MQTHHKTCNLCEATCGVLIDVEDGRVTEIRPDKDDPFSRGHICPKAFSLKEIHEDPDRLKRPLRRTASGWQEVSWDEALSEAAERLAAIQARCGRDAVATYLGNPTAHNVGSALYSQVLLRVLGTHSRFSASSVDQNPKHASSRFLFGNILAIPVPDIDRTHYMLIAGANPLASNGSIMTAPDIRNRLKGIQKRGGKFVVVDPRRSETARLADEHVFIRPGYDGLFFAALLYVLAKEKKGRGAGRLAPYVKGEAELLGRLAPFSPEAVAGALSMEAETIRRIAEEFAAAPSAACYGRTGTCLHEFGTLNSWLVDAVNLLSGNLDREGGAMFTSPAIDLRALLSRSGQGGHMGVWKSRVRGIPEFNGELSVACLAEEILTPGEGRLRGLLSIAGNPVLSNPNGRKLDRALAELEYFVAVDIYVNETTRHANLILPPAWSLEQDNYEAAFHAFAVRNTAKFSPAIFKPEKGMKEDWELLSDLTLRIAEKKGKNVFQKGLWRLARRAGIVPGTRTVIDLLLRTGPYGDKFNPFGDGLSVKKLLRHPEGIDLGPLRPCLDEVIQTEDRKIDLAHPIMMGELERLAGFLRERAAAGVNGDLLLIGRRDLRTNNSWSHNSPILVKGGARCDLLMNPADAARLTLENGQQVKVKSRVGEVTTRLSLTDEIMPGVVSLPHGWGHGREGVRLSVAGEHPGVSVNDLTDEQLIEPVVGNVILNGVPVTVASA